MTGNTNKARAVFLAALMVFSVFAGTVAFSGSAAAASEVTYGGNAVHYANASNGPVIEVPFEGGPLDSASVDNITVLDDDEDITDEVVTSYILRDAQSSGTGNSTLIIDLNSTVSSQDLEVNIPEEVENTAGTPVTNPGEKSVVFAGNSREFTGVSGAAPNSPGNATVYQGATVAINTSNSGDEVTDSVDVTVEGEDNNYFAEGSTGTNSSVYTFQTEDRELGEYKVYVQGNDTQANRTFINIRDLDLNVEIDDLNVSTEDTIEADVSAVAGNRNIEAVLLDSNGDTVNTSSVNQLDGQAEADVDFDTATADDGQTLDEGTYTVEVTDNNTGITVESSEIQVSEADDEEASFANNAISNERGDIVEFTVEMTETDFATVSFGSSEDGVVANATFEDEDGDGEVTAYLNTFEVDDGTGPGGDVFYLDSESDDAIVAQRLDTRVTDLIDAGDYDLEVEAGDQSESLGADPVSDSDDIATVTLNERGTETFRTWTAPSGLSVSDLEDVNEALAEGEITQSSDISNGDLVVHQLVASGFEGALKAQQNDDVTSTFLTSGLRDDGGVYNLTVAEADPGANQDPKNVELGTNNATVVADGPNDTYFVIFDTDNVNYYDGSSISDDTALEANFTVINNDASSNGDFVNEDEFDSDEDETTTVSYDVVEPDITVNEPFNVSQASGQTVTGETTLAPSSEMRIRVRSQDGVSPSFLKTATPEVQPDGTFSATFDFSGQNVGDEYDIIVRGPSGATFSETSEEGQVVESVATGTATPEPTDTDTATPEPTDTDTATPEPTDTDTAMPTDEPTDTPTSTPTSTPGFGVVVALTALLAAALLAVRRD